MTDFSNDSKTTSFDYSTDDNTTNETTTEEEEIEEWSSTVDSEMKNGNKSKEKYIVKKMIKRKICMCILCFCIVLFIVINIVEICIYIVGRSKKMMGGNYINGLKYGYKELIDKDVSGERKIVDGGIYLESKKLIGRNYELVVNDVESSSVYIFNKVFDEDENNARKIIAGYDEQYPDEYPLNKYDCKANCICSEIKKKKRWGKKKKDEDEEVVKNIIPFYRTLYNNDEHKNKILEEFLEITKSTCPSLSTKKQECVYEEGSYKCYRRTNIHMWICLGVCYTNDEKLELKEIRVSAKSGKNANYVAENFFFYDICRKHFGIDEIGVESACAKDVNNDDYVNYDPEKYDDELDYESEDEVNFDKYP